MGEARTDAVQVIESQEDLSAQAAELARRDPALARLVAAIGPPRIRPALEGSFAGLVRAIAFQQLAGRAAAAIHGRFVANFPDGIAPGGVLALPEEAFRAAGLSAAKTRSIRDLAEKVVAGTVPLDDIDAMADAEIVDRLCRVRGIGRWTAEMFLLFQLRRLDVWPVDDLAVRRGYAIAQGLAAPPTPRELRPLGDPYRPYRSVAAWYCWRATDTVLPEG